MGDAIGFKVDLAYLRKLSREFPEATEREAIAVVDLIVRRLEEDVVEKTPTGVGGGGGLAGSIHGEVVRFGATVAGTVGTPLEYGRPVEYGTRPHYPPRRPIVLWAARKLGLSGVELRRAVRAIQWKIYQHGTEGAHMFEDTFRERDSWMMQMLETIPQRVVGRLQHG